MNSSHSPAGSLLGNAVENVGNECRSVGLHDDDRKLGFDKVDKGRKDGEEEARDSDRGTARVRHLNDSILEEMWRAKKGSVVENY